jgi:hypothetical protein
MLSTIYFAHNGINHATHMEAAAHESNVFVWVLLVTIALAAGLYSTKRLFSNRQIAEESEEDEE